MAFRKVQFVDNEYYHVFNRGVDKREIFIEPRDSERFFQCMEKFNTTEPIGSIFEDSFRKEPLGRKTPKLVNFICYCINPNHYHFVLEQISDRGIEKFMQKLGTGYTNYFNKKYKRTGSLFQGKFKSVHVDSNEYLLFLSAYVNLNNEAHKIESRLSNLFVKSSWEEYVFGGVKNFCTKDIILNQFNNREEYKNFAKEALVNIKEKKEMEKLLIE
jgi:REP element-mobilizing transposase RayT